MVLNVFWKLRTLQIGENQYGISIIIYHDEAMQIKIEDAFSFEEGTKHFIRVPDCFLDTYFGYGYAFQIIDYIDLTRKFNWMSKHDAGNQPCSREFSMERYALSMMNMAPINLTSNASDNSELWMNDDMHCMWPSVECKQGLVVGLDTIFGYGYDSQQINYIDLTRKYNWIVENDAGNKPCSRDFSME